MKDFTEEQIEEIAKACGWKYHSPAKPLPMAKDSDAKAYLTWHWETPDGLGAFEGPDIEDLNVVMDLVKNFLETAHEYRLNVTLTREPRIVSMKNNFIIYEEIIEEYAELASSIVEALWVAIKHKLRGKI